MRRWLPAPFVLLLAAGGCTAPPPEGERTGATPATAADTGPGAARNGSAEAGASGALEAVPSPSLAGADPAVLRQLEEERAALDRRLERDTRGAELAEALGRMGRLYHGYDLLEPAAACYRNAQRLQPADHRWPYYLGAVYQRRGRLEEAAGLLRRVLELAPDEAAALERLGRIELLLERPAAAEPLFERALEIEPRCAAALYGMGEAARAAGDLERAASRFRRTLELQPEAFQVHYPLAQTLLRLGRRTEAEEHLRLSAARPLHVGGMPLCPSPLDAELAALATGAAVHVERGLRAGRRGAAEVELEEFRRAVEVSPQDPVAHHGLGSALYRRQEFAAAAEALRRAVALDPGRADYRFDLGQTLLQLGSDTEAAALFRAALELDPGLGQARLKLAEIELRAGNPPAAIAQARALVDGDPDAREARVLLTMALLRAGRRAEGLAQIAWLLDESPPFDPAEHLMLAGLLVPLGDPDRALRHLRTLLDGDADDAIKARAHFGIGRIQLGRGQADAAVASFESALALAPELAQARQALAMARRAAGG